MTFDGTRNGAKTETVNDVSNVARGDTSRLDPFRDWVDKETLAAIDWHAYWDAFRPVSPYGQQVKRELHPHLPGAEHEAESTWRELREDASRWSDAQVASLRDGLARLPDIRDTLSILEWSAAPLTPKHFLALKQFAVRGLRLMSQESGTAQSTQAAPAVTESVVAESVVAESVVAESVVAESEPEPGARTERTESGPGAPASSETLKVYGGLNLVSWERLVAMFTEDWTRALNDGAPAFNGTPAFNHETTAHNDCAEDRRFHTKETNQTNETNESNETSGTRTVSESFSIDDLGFNEYKRAVAGVAAATHRLAGITRDQHQLWAAATGSKLRRDGQLVIPLPSHQDLAVACKQDSRLRWLRDTPFESIFDVLPSPELAQAKADLDEAKEALQQAEQHALTELTGRVKLLLPEWTTAAQAIAILDIRIAKVKMLREFGGCVPAFGTSIVMDNAVHPEVASRLREQGGRFTPVTLRPRDGVNILFGSNMGGKTLSLSMLVACQLLAQYGLPVPAVAFHTGLFAAIRFAATSGTDIHSGLSAYGSEVVRVSNCWRAFEGDGPVLMVFDEPVRSTNPLEGAALVTGLVRAAIARTAARQSVVWVATHFADPLLEPGIAKFRVRGLRHPDSQPDSASHIDDQQRRLQRLEEAMDYRIEEVTEFSLDEHQEALPVAKYLGAPSEWLLQAQAFLREGR